MKCKTCLYPLWRIKARQCPECGAGFKPSEYEFVLNSVRYRCQHCEQEYYGDGDRGHLNPVEFDCVKCGQHIHMDEMTLEPAAGVTEERTEIAQLPWLDRAKVGWWKGVFRTIGLALTGPREAMAMTPVESSSGQAIRFFLVTQVMVWLVALVPMVVLMLGGALFALQGARAAARSAAAGGTVPPPTGAAVAGPMAVAMGGMVVGAIVFSILMFGVFTLCTHGVLAITGGTRGLRRTLQAMAYSSGANVITAVPCVGGYVGWIWWLVSAVIMVKEGHAVRWWRAVLAVLGPIFIVIALFVGAYAWFVVMAISGVTTAATQRQQLMQLSSHKQLGIAMIEASTRDGHWPAHIAELVRNGSAIPQDFVNSSDGSQTQVSNIMVGPLNLSDFHTSMKARQDAALAVAKAGIGAEAPAYRLGDVVVCVRETDSSDLPFNTWLLVSWRDPSVNSGALSEVAIVQVDGAAHTIPIAEFDAALAAQNAVRMGAEMKALPHPRDVRTGGVPVKNGPESP